MNKEKTLRILVVGNDQHGVRSLCHALAARPSAAKLTTAESLKLAATLAGQQAFDVAFLDLSLPDSNGLGTITSFVAACPTLPVVALTEAGQHDLAVEVIRAGAQDYLVKGSADGDAITRVARYAIERKHSQLALEQAHAVLEEKVRYRTAHLNKAMEDLRSESHERITTEVRRRRAKSVVLAAVEREQRRIGRDLHDSIQGSLAGMNMLLGSLRRNMVNGTGDPVAQLDEIRNVVRQVLDQVRGLARSLCPVDLKEEGLLHALEQLAKTTSSLFRVQCDFVHNRPAVLADESVAGHLYYISHEAINNAIKHAKAKKISIQLHVGPERLKLAIEDDGVGIPADHCKLDGMGLRTMAYRASVIGADLSVRPGDRKGTVVECSLQGKYDAQPS